LALEALRIDRSPTGLELVLAARAVPAECLALAGGIVVDRVPRRLSMLVSDAVRGLAVGAIAVLVAEGELRLFELIVMSAVFGTANAFFRPASHGLLARGCGERAPHAGNALSQTSSQLAQGLAGPAAGGVVVAGVGTAWSFGIDALSFAVSSVCLVMMRARSGPPASGRSAFADAREGLRYVRSTRWLVASLLRASLANFFAIAPLSVLLPLLVRHVLKSGPLALGLVFAARGAAGVAASLVVAHVGSPRYRVTVLWTAYTAGSAAIAFMANRSRLLGSRRSECARGMSLFCGDVLWMAMVQELVPRRSLAGSRR
jgi:hypothetical protein